MTTYKEVQPGEYMVLPQGEAAVFVKVLRITPSQIILTDGERFSRTDGLAQTQAGRPAHTGRRLLFPKGPR
jgi:hypothetical protein